MAGLLMGCGNSPKGQGTGVPDPPIEAPKMSATQIQDIKAKAKQAMAGDSGPPLRQANKALQGVVADNPKDDDAIETLAIAHMRLGEFNYAMREMEKAVAIKATTQRYHNLGNIFIIYGYFDRAVLAYRAALEMAPNDPEIMSNLANAHNYAGQNEEALAIIDQVIAARPNDHQPHGTRCLIMFFLKDYDSAEQSCRQAITLNANFASGYYNLSQVLIRQKKKRDAGRMLQEYLRLRPNAPEAGYMRNSTHPKLLAPASCPALFATCHGSWWWSGWGVAKVHHQQRPLKPAQSPLNPCGMHTCWLQKPRWRSRASVGQRPSPKPAELGNSNPTIKRWSTSTTRRSISKTKRPSSRMVATTCDTDDGFRPRSN